MTAGQTADFLDADLQRVALEAIATLVNVKKIAVSQLLRPAGVPEELIRRFLMDRDLATNSPITKRQGGALILDELESTGESKTVVRKLIGIAAEWTGFHLAQDEYKARAVVQKARELTGRLEEIDGRERIVSERASHETREAEARAAWTALTQQSSLLLAQFDAAMASDDHQGRGYLLQDLLNRALDLHGIPVVRPFTRNSGGEQIDGAFELEGWHYLVECRWRAKPADIRDLDGLYGQLQRSGRQTMGLFLSINGWSENVIPLIKQNPAKNVILMEGFDLRSALARPLDMRQFLKAKVTALNLQAEPFLSAVNFK